MSNESRAKACTTCAKAKSGCVRRPEYEPKCERCHRLSKVCISQSPATPRPKNPTKRSRVAQLEERLEELSSQLQDAACTPPSSEAFSAPSSVTLEVRRGGQVGGLSTSFSHIFPADAQSNCNLTEDSGSPSAMGDSVYGSWDVLWPGPAEADGLLGQFRKTHAHVFPFVVVPEDLNEAQMRVNRPFLWKAVMLTTSSANAPRQIRMGDDLLSEIGQNCHVYGNTSLDMLQGLLLLITWFHCPLRSHRLTNLLFIARSVCLNLGLGVSNMQDPRKHPLEHIRAYTGVYYVNTLVLAATRRSDALMNTTYVDGCCSILEEVREYQSDGFLVQLVRVQQLTQHICNAMHTDLPYEPGQIPVAMMVHSFQAQLDTFRQNLPRHLTMAPMLKAHVQIATIQLTEIATSDERCSYARISMSDRLIMLWTCIRALKSYILIRTGALESGNPSFPGLSGCDIIFVLKVGIKLMSIQPFPGWDYEDAWQELALGEALDRLIHEVQGYTERRNSGMSQAQSDLLLLKDPYARGLPLLMKMRETFKLWQDGLMDSDNVGGLSVMAGPGLAASIWNDLESMDVSWELSQQLSSAGPCYS